MTRIRVPPQRIVMDSPIESAPDPGYTSNMTTKQKVIEAVRTLPDNAIAPVVIAFNTIFVAVPAFNRVDPGNTSGPVGNTSK